MKLTKEQASLLLFLETRLVDHRGRVKTDHMNASDMTQAELWSERELIGFGRIAYSDITPNGSHWVTFSNQAWGLAHAERRARSERMMKDRSYRTTKEKAAVIECTESHNEKG